MRGKPWRGRHNGDQIEKKGEDQWSGGGTKQGAIRFPGGMMEKHHQ